MPRIEITDGVDPLLKVDLDKGEVFFAESNSMVAMDASLSLEGSARGGFLHSLSRKFLNDESFFQEKISADEGGSVLLTPLFPGDVRRLEIGSAQYCVSDGSYLANTEGVSFETITQSIGKALFAKNSGLFILKSKGEGGLFVSGFGSIREIALDGSQEVIIDNGHLVAWDASLKYTVSLSTAKQGFFGKLVNSQISGEGIVLRFKGKGKILICSRNRGGFIDWIISKLPLVDSDNKN